MRQHTVGPWYACMNEVMDYHGHTLAVAKASMGPYAVETAIANAGLIAAAPDMLKALLHIEDVVRSRKMLTEREIRDVQQIAMVAIGKAVLGSEDGRKEYPWWRWRPWRRR